MTIEELGFDLDKVIALHNYIISEFGGSRGMPLGGRGKLHSAIHRPFHGTADGQRFYPSIFQRAAALLHGVLKCHPFVDGNKRTAFALTILFLYRNGFDWRTSETEAVVADFLVRVEQDTWSLDDLAKIIDLTCRRIKKQKKPA